MNQCFTSVGVELGWTGSKWAQGLSLFSLGFVMKALTADQFAIFVAYAYGPDNPDFVQSWIGVMSYTFQLYYDFWSYSIMATGLGLCLGVAFQDNFRAPYRSLSITEFWRRWHISPSQWLRDYLYFSLGGSHHGAFRRSINLFLTMLVAGLWHGANYTFLLWGAVHGLILVIERSIGSHRLEIAPFWLRRIIPFIFIVFGWALFRSDDLNQAVNVICGMIGLNGFDPNFNSLLLEKNFPAVAFCVLGWIIWTRAEFFLVGETPISCLIFKKSTQYLLFFSFLVSLLFILSSKSVPFLYFQF